MADSDDAGGLFSIAISDDEQESTPKNARNLQSEDAFQALKASYAVKVENGELWRDISLPITGRASKPQAQEVLHAIEELYFFRRYDEGASFARRVLDTSSGALDDENRAAVALYEEKCLEKIRKAEGAR